MRRRTAVLNRGNVVINWLVDQGFTRGEAIKAWSKEIRPAVTIDMDVKEIIQAIEEGWEEQEAEERNVCAGG